MRAACGSRWDDAYLTPLGRDKCVPSTGFVVMCTVLPLVDARREHHAEWSTHTRRFRRPGACAWSSKVVANHCGLQARIIHQPCRCSHCSCPPHNGRGNAKCTAGTIGNRPPRTVFPASTGSSGRYIRCGNAGKTGNAYLKGEIELFQPSCTSERPAL